MAQNVQGWPGARRRRPTTARTDIQVGFWTLTACLIIALLSEETGLSVGTVPSILTKVLAMKKVCMKLVSEALSEEQKPSRVNEGK